MAEQPAQDSDSPETLPEPLSQGGALTIGQSTQELTVLVHNAVAFRLLDLVNELFENIAYRPERGGNLAANNKAAEMLLALVGIYPLGTATETAAPGGLTINTHGPAQINAQRGPDRLTQELIDIVRKGNNGKGNGKPKE